MVFVIGSGDIETLTYGRLLDDIATWLARDDLDSVIPTFVRLAISDVTADLRLRVNENRETYAFTGSPLVLPTDFLAARGLYADTIYDRSLTYLSPARFGEAAVQTDTGNPSAYTIVGNSIYLAPTSAGADPVTVILDYVAKPEDLNETEDSNAILQSWYDVYLYAALKHGFSYIRDDEQAFKYKTEYQEKVAKLNRNANRERFFGTKLIRTGAPTP